MRSKVAQQILDRMENEKWWNGFLVGFFVGGVIGIIILTLVHKGII